MSIFNFHLSFLDGNNTAAAAAAVAALILIAAGGGTYAVIRRNHPPTPQDDPESVELEAIRAARDGVARSANDGGVGEQTTAVDGAGPLDQIGVVEGSITLGAVEGADASEETRAGDDAGTLEVSGAVDDGVALGVDAST